MLQDRRDGREKGDYRIGNSKRVIFRRTVVLMVLLGVVMFVPIICHLWDLSVVQHDHFQQLATRQQTLDRSVSASRGNIYDCSGNVLAMSSTVYELIVSPRDLVASVPEKDYTDREGNLNDAAYRAAVEAKQRKTIEDLLLLRPELDREKVTAQVMDTKKAYKEVAKDIEEEDAEAIRTYIKENKTSFYLYLTPGTRRYYPYSELAAQAIGFTNAEGGATCSA